MDAMGIIRRSSSPWASPLHMASKTSGGWRPCGDYRRLNEVTVYDRYPVPHILIQDFSAHLAGMTIFFKVDFIRGYHQIPVAMHRGHFENCRHHFFRTLWIPPHAIWPGLEWCRGKSLPRYQEGTRKRNAILTHTRPDAKTSLTVDASDLAVGAVPQQFVDGAWVSLAFFNQKLYDHQRESTVLSTVNYSLSIYLGIRHFRYFVEGTQFIAFTDHKPLNILHVQNLRSMVKLSAAPPFLHLQVHDRRSTCAREGELGCRHIVESNHLGCSTWDRLYFAMATAQQEDAEVQACCTANSSLQLEDIPFGARVTL